MNDGFLVICFIGLGVLLGLILATIYHKQANPVSHDIMTVEYYDPVEEITEKHLVISFDEKETWHTFEKVNEKDTKDIVITSEAITEVNNKILWKNIQLKLDN